MLIKRNTNLKEETKVPKTIHLMWFSGDEYPEDIQTCIDSWKRVLPDFKIKVWTKDMAMQCNIPYMLEALDCKKWAFAADVLRLYALYTEGGVYMDSDILVLKRFDEFMINEVAFFQEYHKELAKKALKLDIINSEGCRTGDSLPCGIGLQAAFIIAQKGNRVIKHLLDYYQDKHFVKPNGEMATDTISPTIFALRAEGFGYRYLDEEQTLFPGIKVYPSCYVAPGKNERDKRNFAIHCISHSWAEQTLRYRIIQMIKKPIRKLMGIDVKSLAKKANI